MTTTFLDPAATNAGISTNFANINPGWGQAGNTSISTEIDSVQSMKIANLNYQGNQLNANIDFSGKFIHMQIYPTSQTTLSFYLVNSNSFERYYSIPNLVAGQWNPVVIDVNNDFNSGSSFTSVHQFKWTGGANGTNGDGSSSYTYYVTDMRLETTSTESWATLGSSSSAPSPQIEAGFEWKGFNWRYETTTDGYTWPHNDEKQGYDKNNAVFPNNDRENGGILNITLRTPQLLHPAMQMAHTNTNRPDSLPLTTTTL